MKVGDLVTYGKWYCGSSRIGIILDAGDYENPSWLVMWTAPHEPEWECEDEMEVINENI
tara:strand:+ start:371 stop:547 length:177 start_codon:yes stop_codon:yes gene_type:complete